LKTADSSLANAMKAVMMKKVLPYNMPKHKRKKIPKSSLLIALIKLDPTLKKKEQ
jgi:hypothetical protein